MPEESLPLHDTLLAAAAQQLTVANTLLEKVDASARELKESYQLTRRLKMTIALGLVLMLLQVGQGIAVVVTVLRTSQVVSTIKDCTDPHGKCAQRGQTQTGQAIAQIISRDVEGFIVVTECARRYGTDGALESCVTRHLPQGAS
jgi:hypothetical protein